MRGFTLLLAGIGLLFAHNSVEAQPSAPKAVMPTVYEPKTVWVKASNEPSLPLAVEAPEAPATVKYTAAAISGAAIHTFLSSVY